MTDTPLFAILYDAKDCDCERCKAYYEWFDSDAGGDPEDIPQPCGSNIIAFIDFREKGGER